jgi:nitrogen fixation/metabolism regulation signal transduction histidine kinase
MCAVSFLPAWWVFVVAAGNCLFTLFDLLFMPSSGELHELLKAAAPGIIVPILLSQIIVSTVAFLWVRSAEKAIQRADQAEEIARLEHDMALQAEAIAGQKQQLDISIQSIVETHTRVANGDFHARVPLTQDNVLWQISGSLNNLLARLQRLRQAASELRQMQLALKQAREENARLKKLLGGNIQ